MLSQSPLIGSMILTMMLKKGIERNVKSQSPLIGSMILTAAVRRP
jgi:hypothetical protein